MKIRSADTRKRLALAGIRSCRADHVMQMLSGYDLPGLLENVLFGTKEVPGDDKCWKQIKEQFILMSQVLRE